MSGILMGRSGQGAGLSGRIAALEKRIIALEKQFGTERDRILDEDLKARGLK